jgi:hypothetical protein
MQSLMGVTKGRNADGLQQFILPEPLRINEDPRIAPDATRLWNPDWRQDSTFPTNLAYLNAVADLILDKETVNTLRQHWKRH